MLGRGGESILQIGVEFIHEIQPSGTWALRSFGGDGFSSCDFDDLTDKGHSTVDGLGGLHAAFMMIERLWTLREGVRSRIKTTIQESRKGAVQTIVKEQIG